MDLEGTKHEKAVLVVISFIIGFTCGLITFGINDARQPTLVYDDVYVPMDETPTAAPPLDFEGYEAPTGNPPSDEMDTDAGDMPTSDEPVSYENGRLYAKVGEERFVLSLRSDVMEVDNVEGFATQGLHQDLPAYSASPSGEYIYFCEQQTADPECTNFVFDTKAGMVTCWLSLLIAQCPKRSLGKWSKIATSY
jgi:hypothetical protein